MNYHIHCVRIANNRKFFQSYQARNDNLKTLLGKAQTRMPKKCQDKQSYPRLYQFEQGDLLKYRSKKPPRGYWETV
jgi:hypothetical protein